VDGDLVDINGRRLERPNFPKLERQTPIQRTFLKRLQRLTLLGRYGERHIAFTDEESALLKSATYSVFQDCVELGVGREARAILRAYKP